MTIVKILLAGALLGMLGHLGAVLAVSASYRTLAVITRVVTDEASVSYSVGGRVVQSMPLRAGTYRVTVEELR